jgi:lysyl-tRNA synthetase class 2
MKPTIVESTTLATVAYDADRQLLQIEFRDRTTYRYFNVPTDVHETLLRARSKGSYFNRVIRRQFAYVRVHADWLDRALLS